MGHREGVQRKGKGKGRATNRLQHKKSGKEFVEKGSKKERKEEWAGGGEDQLNVGKLASVTG